VRYYSASSLGPFRSQCAYAGADPCGKPQKKNNDNTHIYINQSSSYITIIILLSDNRTPRSLYKLPKREREKLQTLLQSLYRKNRSVVLMQRIEGMPRHVILHPQG
jgi:hypothetical protein